MSTIKLPILPAGARVREALGRFDALGTSGVVVELKAQMPNRYVLLTAKDLRSGLTKMGDVALSSLAATHQALVHLPTSTHDQETEWDQALDRLDQKFGLIQVDEEGKIATVKARYKHLTDLLRVRLQVYSCQGDPSHTYLDSDVPADMICPVDGQPIA